MKAGSYGKSKLGLKLAGRDRVHGKLVSYCESEVFSTLLVRWIHRGVFVVSKTTDPTKASNPQVWASKTLLVDSVLSISANTPRSMYGFALVVKDVGSSRLRVLTVKLSLTSTDIEFEFSERARIQRVRFIKAKRMAARQQRQVFKYFFLTSIQRCRAFDIGVL